MNFPDFFHAVPTIKLYDPLAHFLGATSDGVLEYSYADVVRLAGHSCPTVATAFGATRQALAALYPDTMPVRGDIRVDFQQPGTSGVTGVIANVVSMLTGAMSDSGFKGIGGQFERRNHLFFTADIPDMMRFTRLDTQRFVQVAINLHHVPASPLLPALMASCLASTATAEEVEAFQQLWQGRVQNILLEHGDDPNLYVITVG